MTKNDDLLNSIQSEILARNGLGFKVELSPILVKYEVYEIQNISCTENSDAITWVLLSEKNPNKQMYSQPGFKRFKYDQISIEELPNGIILEKTSPCVLHDGRVASKFQRRKKKKVSYKEGQRVYLTVSNEYASRIFKEVYTDIGMPFRNKLLSKHQVILNEIVEYLGTSTYGENSFTVYEGAIDCSFHSDAYYFKDVYMKPLSSIGQMYGMALALIETLKKYDFEWNNYLYTISAEDGCIHVDYSRSEELAESNLKDW